MIITENIFTIFLNFPENIIFTIFKIFPDHIYMVLIFPETGKYLLYIYYIFWNICYSYFSLKLISMFSGIIYFYKHFIFFIKNRNQYNQTAVNTTTNNNKLSTKVLLLSHPEIVSINNSLRITN